MNWVILVVGAATCMTKHAGINSNHTKPNEPLPPLPVYKLCLHLSPPSGSFTSSASTDAGNTTGATTDSVDQVSPTMPRATKNRVSGKLRRSASAISKSSNWALQPRPTSVPPPRVPPLIFSRRTSHTQPRLQDNFFIVCWCVLFFFVFYFVSTNMSLEHIAIFNLSGDRWFRWFRWYISICHAA